MKVEVRTAAVGLCSVLGSALAGPAGGLIGNFAGGMLAAVLPGASAFLGEVVSDLSGRAIESSAAALVEHLSPQEKQRINHDLQTAFRDAFRAALFDLGGERCFPAAWKPGRDVPPAAVYTLIPEIEHLWRSASPLAEQTVAVFENLVQELEQEKLLPLDPPRSLPEASVGRYLEAFTPLDLSAEFYRAVVAPAVAHQGALASELPGFAAHLQRYLLDRTLVHLGELLKARTPAWRAFNRLMLEGLQEQVQQVAGQQEELQEALRSLLEGTPANLTEFSSGLADLIGASGRLEKQVGEGFDSVLARLGQQHSEVLVHFQSLHLSGLRIETKVDRVLHILEDGRYIVEGKPLVPVDTPPAAGKPPFKGLRFFKEVDAELFFGREELTYHLVDRLHAAQHDPAYRLLALVGASGSGKSSLVRAGLLPELRRSVPGAESLSWAINLITPTAHPLQVLAKQIAPHAAGEQAAAMLHNPRLLFEWAEHLSPDSQPLLVVDQFEEVFTLCREEAERQAWIDNLMTAVSEPGRLAVVLTLRADFYTHCSPYAALRAALERNQVFLGPMSAAEMRRAIEQPAHKGGWEFEPGLVDLILRETGQEPGALPLLSHALLETWQHRRGRVLTLESYAEAGGVRGAIAHSAESVYQRMNREEQALARRIFLRLTEPGLGTQDTRRRASLEELTSTAEEAPRVERVLLTLSQARLVVIDQGRVEVAHEALIREWPSLRQWLDEDRAGLLLHRQLGEDAGEWAGLGRDPDALYRGARLTQALEWAGQHAEALNPLEREFVGASQSAAERLARDQEAVRRRELQTARQLAAEAEARRQAETARARQAEQAAQQLSVRNRVITAVGGIAALAAVVACLLGAAAGFFGLQSGRSAANAERSLGTAQAAQAQAVQEAGHRATAEGSALFQKATAEAAREETALQSRVSRARELASRALSVLPRNQETGMLLAVEAYRAAQAVPEIAIPEASTALYQALETGNFAYTLRAHQGEVWTAIVSPDGFQLLTLGIDNQLIRWSPKGEKLGVLSGPTGSITSAGFNQQGNRIAATSEDGSAYLWDSSGTPIATLSNQGGSVLWINFSKDGQTILTGGRDGNLRLWSAQGVLQKTILAHPPGVFRAIFSPDGKWIASTGFDNEIALWKASDGSLVKRLQGHTSYPLSLAFSPDSSLLVSAGSDGKGFVWTNQGKLQATLSGHKRSLTGAVFSPDGSLILTSSFDNTARLWGLDGTLLTVFQGHTGPLVSAVFHPDGQRILTASHDNTARLWGLDGQAYAVLRGHSGYLDSARFSPDGSWIVTAGEDGTARIWNTPALHNLPLRGHTGFVWFAGFSPDGKTLVTTAGDGAVRLWEPDGRFRQELLAWAGPSNSAQFNPAGDRLIVAYYNGLAVIWSLQGDLLARLEGHQGEVTFATYRPDGEQIATCGADGSIRLWSAEGSFQKQLTSHTNRINRVAYSPDSSLIAVADSDGLVQIWTVEGKLLLTLPEHGGPVASVSFSPDGQMLLTGSWDRTARLWSLDGILLHTFEGQNDLVNMAVFSSDGQRVLIASLDGTASLYQADGTFITALEGHTSWVASAQFSPTDGEMLTASADGTARLWGFYGSPRDMLTEILQRVGRGFTEAECRQYLYLDTCPAAP